MLSSFLQFVKQHDLFKADQSVLLAVSGGIDSMVMAHLFHLAGFQFGIAHCNFGLRGIEADEDEALVKKMAALYKASYYHVKWDTEQIAKENKESIQVCARNLRYRWLHEIKQANGYHYVATAHHLNDSIETILYNFSKGCGIKGLQGIPLINEYIIRPLLFASKASINEFQDKFQLPFREDASNNENKYNRNKIRNEVIPVLKTINPGFEYTMAQNIERLNDIKTLYDFAINSLTSHLVEANEDGVKVQYTALKKLPAAATLLFEVLHPYGFNSSQIKQLLNDSNEQTGSVLYSEGYRMLLDRGVLIILPNDTPKLNEMIQVEEGQDSVHLAENKIIELKLLEQIPNNLKTLNSNALLDMDKLVFPLMLRKWKAGDQFQPLGMKGRHQSLQDFFTNNKLSKFEKENCWLLLSEKKICWVVGYRIDERFKIKTNTQRCLSILLKTKKMES